MNYSFIHDMIINRARTRIYDSTVHHNHHIIPVHENKESTEVVPLTIKEHCVIHHLRYKITGTIGNKMAWLFLKGIVDSGILHHMMCSNAGKIGGKTTKTENKGIFSKEYDRSAQTKKNWENEDIRASILSTLLLHTSDGGKATKNNKVGIFDPSLQHLRREWAKIGSNALTESGNRKGCASLGWAKENSELQKQNASKGGKMGGKAVGVLPWWTNGTINKRSYTSPGEDWAKGMTKQIKRK